MSLFKKRHFGSVLLMLFLVACGGGDDDSTQKTPQVTEQTLKVNSTFSATFLQWVKNDRSGVHLSSEASLNEVSEQGETNFLPLNQSVTMVKWKSPIF